MFYSRLCCIITAPIKLVAFCVDCTQILTLLAAFIIVGIQFISVILPSYFINRMLFDET